jgi:hypothetical protein
MAADKTFGAFVSYRRVLPDALCAVALQDELEGFKIPRPFRKDRRTRIGRVYLDQRETTVGRLQESLGQALAASEALIVICSKRTRESPWVDEEIREFLASHGDDAPVVAVLLESTIEESYPDGLLGLHRTGSDASSDRVHVVRGEHLLRRRWFQRRLNVPIVGVAAALLRVEPDALARALMTEAKRRMLLALAIVLVGSVGLGGVAAWANSRNIWDQTEERRLSSFRGSWDLWGRGAEQVVVTSPHNPPWQWDPKSNQLTQPTERVITDKHRRYAIVYRPSDIAVRNLTSMETRPLPLLPSKLAVAAQYGLKFDDGSERVLVADRSGSRFIVRVISLSSFAVEATIDLGELPDQPHVLMDQADGPPISPEQHRERHASEVWNRVVLIGSRLLAPDAQEPYSPLIRAYPSGAAIRPLLGSDYRFAFPLAFHGGTSRVAAIAVSNDRRQKICIVLMSTADERVCASLAEDPDADFEGGAFSRSGRTLWLTGNDRVAAFDSATLKRLLYVAPPEPLRVIEEADADDPNDGWVLWSNSGKNWAARLFADFEKVDAGGVRVAGIESVFWSTTAERVLVRYDRSVEVVETPTWRRIDGFDMLQGTLDLRPTLDGQGWSVQLVDSQLIVFDFGRGREIARVSGVGGRQHRLWIDGPCQALNVITDAGQVMRFQSGRQYFDRWFIPHRDCPSGAVSSSVNP